MKYMNSKIVCGALSMLTLLGTTSCSSDFLNEDAGHLYTDALLETSDGALSMAAGLYGNIRWHFGYEWAYGITLYGCDEFTNGADLTSEPWNTYDNRLNPLDCTPALGAANKNCPAVSALWDQMYYGISTANLIISKADNVKDEASRNKALGEAHFLRGYNYYRLFCQYGGVALETEPANGDVKKNFERATEEETLSLIIDDFERPITCCQRISGVAMAPGPSTPLLTSWLRHCFIASRNAVPHGLRNTARMPTSIV